MTPPEIPEALRGLIVSTPDTLSGWPRFASVRMPLQVLFDNLVSGATPEQFIEDYGSLTLEQIAQVQAWLKTLPPWDGKDRENILQPYRFMFQEDPA